MERVRSSSFFSLTLQFLDDKCDFHEMYVSRISRALSSLRDAALFCLVMNPRPGPRPPRNRCGLRLGPVERPHVNDAQGQLRAPRRKEEERLSSQKLNRQIEHGEYAFQRFGLVCDPLARLLTYALQMNLGWSPRTCLYYNSGIINNRDLRMVRSIYTITCSLVQGLTLWISPCIFNVQEKNMVACCLIWLLREVGSGGRKAASRRQSETLEDATDQPINNHQIKQESCICLQWRICHTHARARAHTTRDGYVNIERPDTHHRRDKRGDR